MTTANLLQTKKIEKEFSCPYILKHKVVRNLKVVTESNGVLEVSGKGYIFPAEQDVFDRYSIDIDFIRWNGVDIKPVLEVTGGLEEIEEAAIRFFANKYDGGFVK